MSRPAETADWPLLGAGDDLLSVRAAAPDLLDIVRQLLVFEDNAGNPPDFLGGISGESVRRFKEAARAAIAKAEGQS